jgi:hypothetical protein
MTSPLPELVHLVVHPHRTWLAGVHLDEEHAHTHAKSIQGVVASLPITGDYRDHASEVTSR